MNLFRQSSRLSLNIGNSALSVVADGNDVSVYDTLKRLCFAINKKGVLESGKAYQQSYDCQYLRVTSQSSISTATFRDFVMAGVRLIDPAVGIKKNGAFAAGKIEANHGEVKSLKAETLDVKAIISPAWLFYQSIYSRLPDIAHKIGFGQSLAAGVNTQARLR